MKEQKSTKKEQKHNVKSIKGITLIALVITIVVLLILASVSITAVFGDNGLLKLAKEAGEKTNEAIGKEQEGINDLEYMISDNLGIANSPITSEETTNSVTFATNYGKVDIIWLDTNNNVKQEPNKPILSAKNDKGEEETMERVIWPETEGGWGEEPTVLKTDEGWYNYAKAKGTEDTKESKWANARTKNMTGVENYEPSYFVWIPRYAYRITYYEKDWTLEENASQEPTGYYDGWGMYDKDGKLNYELDKGVETVIYKGNKYIVHPAFETNLDMGGWDKDLAGFWFAKYEMSGSKTALASVPQVASLRSINIGDMYKACRDAVYGYSGVEETISSGGQEYKHTSYMHSHLVKNSEWGAVALLTQSAYGRNGHQIDINNYWSSDNNTKTGVGAGGTDTSQSSTVANEYNTEKGAHASTTGNIYGIYDMSGGAWEYTASYDKLGSTSYLTGSSYGMNLTNEAKSKTPKVEGGSDYEYISTKYATAYENGTTDYKSDATVYKVSKTGDAVKEVRTGSIGWFKEYSYVCTSRYPFFKRSGNYEHGAIAGVFCSDYYDGEGYDGYGFRAVLCP